MPIRYVMTDTLTILREGNVIGIVKGRIDLTGATSTTFDLRFGILAGDVLRRLSPGGSSEQYRVLDPGYHAGLGVVPPGYYSRIEKMTESRSGPISSSGDSAPLS